MRRTARRLLPNELLRRVYRLEAAHYLAGLDVSIDQSKKTIIAINHFWNQDLRALAQASTEYNFVVVDAPILFKGAKLYFSGDVQDMRVPYLSEPVEHRLCWRTECRYILNLLLERFGVDLVIAPDDAFYWFRELTDLLHDRGTPVVIVEKEGTRNSYLMEAESRRVRENAPCKADRVYVWSERQRLYWNKAGVVYDKIELLGQPRSDLFHTEERRDLDTMFSQVRPIVTLFSYEDDAYIMPELARAEGLNWLEMKAATHDAFAAVASQHPQYNYVIKTHPQQADLDMLKDRYQLDNLIVLGGSSTANELLRRSELIIAFQTTGVIEAMFLNKPIIYTHWDPLLKRLEDELLPFHRAPGIVVVRSCDELRVGMENFLEGRRNAFHFPESEINSRNRFVNEYFFNPDGHVCERFFASVGILLK
ncbi:MAG: hypothetical protein ACE5FH_02925 [Candidatus Zixiibacteriota bacterium]